MRKSFIAVFCCIIGSSSLVFAAVQPKVNRPEQNFESITIGTQTYSNVTVTTQNKDYVFLLHSRGMLNVKVADLSIETKQLLGYEQKPPPQTPSEWAKKTMVKLDQPEVREMQQKLSATSLHLRGIKHVLSPNMIGLLLLIYLFFCYCSKLICEKAGHRPGALIWLPILQMIPLLRAAGMSPLWLLAFLVPIVHIAAQIIWCVKISQARGKGVLTTILLILPFTGFFAYLYLAFSEAKDSDDDKRIQLMTLETA
jgi:hypothetical protein